MTWEMLHVAQLLPVQSLCADTLSESGVRKGLLMEKEAPRRRGPSGPSNPSEESTEFSFFYVKGKENVRVKR